MDLSGHGRQFGSADSIRDKRDARHGVRFCALYGRSAQLASHLGSRAEAICPAR